MKTRLLVVLLALSAVLFAKPAFAQHDRAADRAAIKTHIESIFQAFIAKDNADCPPGRSQNRGGGQ